MPPLSEQQLCLGTGEVERGDSRFNFFNFFFGKGSAWLLEEEQEKSEEPGDAQEQVFSSNFYCSLV